MPARARWPIRWTISSGARCDAWRTYWTHSSARITPTPRCWSPGSSVHCNFEEARIPERSPATLGYVGDSDHWPQTRKALRNTEHRLVSLLDGETREQLVQTYLGIDIGVGFRRHSDKARYNSAVKLANFMSFGIPAVMSVETGYLEVGLHGTTCLFARDAGEMRLLVNRLVRDPVWRAEMGAAAFEAAGAYHIRNVAAQYRSFLEALVRS
ncbi:MAG: hypothetical protein P8099_13840 [Gemmatimonadota bacterium]